MPRRGRGPSSCAGSWSARRATMENRASRHGVVRAMALSDHRRCVSTRRRARTSWTVTSTRQRRDGPGDDPARRRSGPGDDLGRVPGGVGAERRPRREASRGGTTGGPPCRHTAVAEAISIARSRAPRAALHRPLAPRRAPGDEDVAHGGRTRARPPRAADRARAGRGGAGSRSVASGAGRVMAATPPRRVASRTARASRPLPATRARSRPGQPAARPKGHPPPDLEE